jgi:hypothetical protein
MRRGRKNGASYGGEGQSEFGGGEEEQGQSVFADRSLLSLSFSLIRVFPRERKIKRKRKEKDYER